MSLYETILEKLRVKGVIMPRVEAGTAHVLYEICDAIELIIEPPFSRFITLDTNMRSVKHVIKSIELRTSQGGGLCFCIEAKCGAWSEESELRAKCDGQNALVCARCGL